MIFLLGRSARIATALTAGFFGLLAWFALANVYEAHFFDHGAVVVFYQMARIIAIPYLLWLQYAVGAYALFRLGGRAFPFAGRKHFIASFLLGSALWHIVLLIIGLAGGYYYPVMLLLAGGVMLASWPHMLSVVAKTHLGWLSTLPRGEKLLCVLVLLVSIAFILFRATYPSGGHDFFNHYFTYYKEIVASGNLGPHATWYQYYYTKGLGLYFMSMILFDPLAIHLASTTFIVAGACMVFDFLRRVGHSLLLPLWGVFLYLALYIYTPGRGIFAANGGWGDLEKTHELSAVLLLGCVWLAFRALESRHRAYAVTLCITAAGLVQIFFASGVLAGLFFLLLLVFCGLRNDVWGAKMTIAAGISTGVSMVAVLLINYFATGLPQDQMILYLWDYIDWQKVVKLGYTLELYSLLSDLQHYSENSLPFWKVLPKMIVEYYRLYMLWPLLVVAGLLLALGIKSYGIRIRIPGIGMLAIFLLSTLIFAIFFGGRSQFVSFFRFSSFNYAPTLIVCLLCWSYASARVQKLAVYACAIAIVPWVALREPNVIPGWGKLARSAVAFNTGNYSLRDAISDQRGRAGRLRWGGIYPPMEVIYASLPPHTRVWSMHNHSYCLLPACNVGQYFSQITSPRWYDIALGSVEEGKKIMQEEGLNFIFYSRSIPVVGAADAKDELAAIYKGLDVDNIDQTFGILWTNGWDYLLTWKEESVAPLDADFMDSWRLFQKEFVAPREKLLPIHKLAPLVKKAAEDPSVKHPPRPEW